MTLTLSVTRKDLQSPRRCASIIGTAFKHGFRGRVPQVGLLTDFGTGDSAVYGVKSAIKRITQRADVLDICHNVPLGNILVGAARLREAVTSAIEREDSVYVAVVDPGVGTDRKAIVVQTKTGKYLVGPDNGVLSLAAKLEGIEQIVAIENEELTFLRLARSGTFHGRDLFAPVAGHLARGVPLSEFGPVLPTQEFIQIHESVIIDDPNRLRCGSIIDVDGVHALRLNVPNHIPQEWVGNEARVRIALENRTIGITAVVSKAFDQKPGTPLIVPASTGCLDLVICNGYADETFKIRPSDLGLTGLKPNNTVSISFN